MLILKDGRGRKPGAEQAAFIDSSIQEKDVTFPHRFKTSEQDNLKSATFEGKEILP